MPQNGWFRLESNRKNHNGRQGRNPQRSGASSYMNEAQTHQENKMIYQDRPGLNSRHHTDLGQTQDQPHTQNQDPFRIEAQSLPVAATPNTAAVAKSASPAKPDPYNDGLSTIHSLTVGERGPILREDTVLHEALEEFIHSKKVDRVVHAKGYGAFGYFETTHSMQEYTMLPFLQAPGIQVPVTVRYSWAVSNKGTPDTSRNVRGFSAKFYTNEGIFDLLCNHIPVFLIRDAIRFPESIKAFLPSPTNNLMDPNRFWSFISRAPEAIHFVTWLYSDMGTLKSIRKMRASSVNTYVWRNADDVCRYVKYHWIPDAGEEYISREEATALAGIHPDVAGQDLYDTIAGGESVRYSLHVQLMDPADTEALSYDPLDDTKTWDENQYPLIPVGRMTLNRNPSNYAEEVEKIAFSPANLLPGAELSDDKILQGRSTIYWNAQRHRLGPDFRKIPINQENGKYFTPDQLASRESGRQLSGKGIRSGLPKQDDFQQAGERFHLLQPDERERLVDNIASELFAVREDARATVLEYFGKASPEFEEMVINQMNKYSK